MEGPCGLETGDIGRGDLRERREAGACRVASECAPFAVLAGSGDGRGGKRDRGDIVRAGAECSAQIDRDHREARQHRGPGRAADGAANAWQQEGHCEHRRADQPRHQLPAVETHFPQRPHQGHQQEARIDQCARSTRAPGQPAGHKGRQPADQVIGRSAQRQQSRSSQGNYRADQEQQSAKQARRQWGLRSQDYDASCWRTKLPISAMLLAASGRNGKIVHMWTMSSG